MADVNEMITLLKKEYPGVKIALHYSDPLELLIATILSAQCTDKQVNGVTKNIKKLSKLLVNEFDSKVPDTMEALLTLPGVARKTANIVLSGAFGKIDGIAVDTHVKRIAFRLGLTANTNPEKIEKDLMKIIPKNNWDIFTLLLIHHGRKVCNARKPLCGECVLNKLCKSAFTLG